MIYLAAEGTSAKISNRKLPILNSFCTVSSIGRASDS